MLDEAEEKIIISLIKLENTSKDKQNEREMLREKIKVWEGKEQKRAIHKAIYNQMSKSKDQLSGDYMSNEINREVVTMLRKIDSCEA